MNSPTGYYAHYGVTYKQRPGIDNEPVTMVQRTLPVVSVEESHTGYSYAMVIDTDGRVEKASSLKGFLRVTADLEG